MVKDITFIFLSSAQSHTFPHTFSGRRVHDSFLRWARGELLRTAMKNQNLEKLILRGSLFSKGTSERNYKCDFVIFPMLRNRPAIINKLIPEIKAARVPLAHPLARRGIAELMPSEI